jgi:hypothetical protein
MTCDIFIRSYAKDFPWLHHALRSIQKFATGFRDIVIVIPDTDDLSCLTLERVVKVKDTMDGYLAQQITKLRSDQYTDSDLILVTDSDTLFTELVTPESFMRDGKPIWFMTPWSEEMLAHPGTREWFFVMKNFFGEDPPAEFMRRQPFMFPREVLKGLRDFCYAKFEKSIDDYVRDAGKFSEWNILGMYCWLHHREKFYWMDTTVECPPEKCHQFWSYAPIEDDMGEINRILA